MVTAEQRQRVLAFYDGMARWLAPAVRRVAEDADGVLASARTTFDGLLPELPYLDRPRHSMAASMFACAAMLAVYQVLRERGVDAHAWGRSIQKLPVVVAEEGEAERARAAADAQASQTAGDPREFVFEMLGPDAQSDRGMNVTSCAICQLFAKHQAMELVPYMCAYDDVVSDARGHGLRRTGTIALGATHCDFRFREGGQPQRLADQYPNRIRLEG